MSDDARFCSQCGLPVAATISGQDLLQNNAERDDWLLSRSVARSPQHSGSVGRAVAVVAALVVGLAAFALFRTPTESVEGVADALVVPNEFITHIDPPNSANTRYSTGEAEQATSSSTVPQPESEAALVVTELDGLAGHYIVVASERSVQRIDTDTGDVRVFDTDSLVAGHFEGDLIFLTNEGDLTRTSLAKPGAPTLFMDEPDVRGDDRVAWSSDSGRIDFATYDFEEDGPPQWQVTHVDLEQELTVTGSSDSFSAFGLIVASGSGLFELTGDGYRPLIDGTPRVFGSRYVLVEQCRDPADCQVIWVDRELGGEVDRNIPSRGLSAYYVGVAIGDAGRVVTLIGNGPSTYFDVETGDYLPAEFRTGSADGFGFIESVSPDSRYLASVAPNRDLLLYDLDNKTTSRVPLELNGEPVKTLIVAKEP